MFESKNKNRIDMYFREFYKDDKGDKLFVTGAIIA